MRLVADRFLAHDDGRVFDVATGDRVIMRIDDAGETPEQARWSVRCDRLQKVRHHLIARLIDFGTIGSSSRFEAWHGGATWTGSRVEAARTHALAAKFLQAAGLTAGTSAAHDCVHQGPQSAVFVPDAGTGYPAERNEADSAALQLDVRGVAMIPRPAEAALSELFRGDMGVRPHVVGLWGPPGSGKSAVVSDIARTARTQGFVPLAARFLTGPYAGLWRGRQLLIIDDEAGSVGMEALLHGVMGAPHPHVLILTMIDEPRSVEAIAMDRIESRRLIGAITPPVSDARQLARVRRAADEAGGVVGRFVRALWPGSGAGRCASRSSGVTRIAERLATFETLDRLDESPPIPSSISSWPAPGELAALRRRIESGMKDLRDGRHARGIRQLRQTIGALARRDGWVDAAEGTLTLASALLRRGRLREALAALEQGRQFATKTTVESMPIDLAVLGGEARIDLARLDEAESILSAAVSAARSRSDSVRMATARMALARCNFWRGRYADAGVELAALNETSEWPLPLQMRRKVLGAKAAVGRADFSHAMSLAGQALQLAGADASMQAAAWSAAAFVHLAVGDLEAVGREGAAAVSAARMAHDPLRGIRARILIAEAERRRGQTATSVTQMKRLANATLPPLIRFRCELVASLGATAASARAVVDRHISASGLRALELYVPGAAHEGLATSDPSVDHVDHLVAIMHLCQTAEDEIAILRNVCGRVRQQLHALGVAFFSALNCSCELLVGEGARIDPGIAARTMAAGTGIAPHQIEDRLEAAAPIRYGGATIGALCVRWALGSMYDRSRASAVLTVAAAAAAPVVSGAGARRRREVLPVAGDLRGVTPAIGELRQTIERAAAAPFSVLVIGESGSGKELVARAIHRAGPRRERPFCTLNCAALPDDLVEAELFGHARGAFTGAIADRPGVFEEAHGGTLFLDEVGELSQRAQAKVLRVIQEGELRRVGENASRRVDVRIVSATNRDLNQEAAAGRFRVDLLYRLDVVRIAVPPLRDRREDIAVLAEHLWQEAAARVGSRATLGVATIAALARYDWPGNVRELQNVLAALAVRSPRRGVVPPTALPPQFGVGQAAEAWRLDQARRMFEEQFVRAALVRSGGRRARAAAELGVTRQGLTKLLARLGISDEQASDRRQKARPAGLR
jgi:DNA-binding NtrC family response regulator